MMTRRSIQKSILTVVLVLTTSACFGGFGIGNTQRNPVDKDSDKSGAIDKGFGDSGRLTVDPLQEDSPRFESSYAVYPELQSDDKIVFGYGGDFFLIRYDNNGRRDRSFGSAGGAIIPEEYGMPRIIGHRALTIDHRDRIIVAAAGSAKVFLFRFSSEGQIDRSFAPDSPTPGVIEIAHDGFFNVKDLSVDLSGSILVAGDSKRKDERSNLLFVKIKESGSLDESFGSLGKAEIDLVNDGTDYLGSIERTRDGKFWIAANRHQQGPHLVLARLNQDGSLDSSFGNGGVHFFGHSLELVQPGVPRLLIGESGDLTIYGASISPNTDKRNLFLAKLSATGTVDKSFGSNGVLYLNSNEDQAIGRGQIQQRDGKYVLQSSSYASDRSNKSHTIYRINSNGTIDTTFAGDGEVSFTHAEPDFIAWALIPTGVLIQSNGENRDKILSSAFIIGNDGLEVQTKHFMLRRFP